MRPLTRHGRGARRRRGRDARGAGALLLATGCGVTRGAQSNDMTMLIPNSPGGGYDQTGRAAIAVMENDDITGGSFEVTNVIGAGGSVAMTRLMNAEGDERTMMTAGLGVVGSLYSFGAPYKLDDATPLAQLIEDQEGVLVPADSPYESIEDLVKAWQDDPGVDRRRRRLLARRPRPPLPDAARHRGRHRRARRALRRRTTAAAR